MSEKKTESGLPIIYLGEANGWKQRPEAFESHCKTCDYGDYKIERIGYCYRRYTCQKCGIQYNADSSG